jgi:hypothetical protein
MRPPNGLAPRGPVFGSATPPPSDRSLARKAFECGSTSPTKTTSNVRAAGDLTLVRIIRSAPVTRERKGMAGDVFGPSLSVLQFGNQFREPGG